MKKTDVDMLNGNLLKNLIIFAIPVLLSSLLQLLFNAVDLIVVGQFAGDDSLAAVGSTGALTNLIINLFIGVSVGANVAVARAIGKKDEKRAQDVVHTSMVFSIIAGIFLTFFGIFTARYWLELMDTTSEAIDKATLYLQIYFGGMVFNMVYNFGASILRAVGETKKPLYYLAIAGIVNVLLNLLFVIVFHLDVAGVAIATITSQGISAVLVVICLMKRTDCVNLCLKKLKIEKKALFSMILIGLPAGIQGSLFSISNVIIQKSVNSFEITELVAGNTAAVNIEGFIYVAMNAFYHACLSFTGQNYGAGNIKRCKKVLLYSLGCVIVVGLLFGGLSALFASPLIGLYTSGEIAIEYGIRRLSIIGATYFLCGFMDVIVGGLRGFGNSIIPMFVSVLGVCGFRLVWIYTVFAQNRSYEGLMISYPISWIVTGLIHLTCYFVVYSLIKKKINNSKETSVN